MRSAISRWSRADKLQFGTSFSGTLQLPFVNGGHRSHGLPKTLCEVLVGRLERRAVLDCQCSAVYDQRDGFVRKVTLTAHVVRVLPALVTVNDRNIGIGWPGVVHRLTMNVGT